MIELGQELAHIRRAAAYDEEIGVLGGQERLYAVLTPDPVSAAPLRRSQSARVAVDLHPLRVFGAVRIYGLTAAHGKLSDDRRLAGSRHPCDQNTLHQTYPSLGSGAR